MIDDLQRRSHRLWTMTLAAIVLAAVAALAILAPAYTTELNGYAFLRFPLGFYLAAQGALVIFVVLIFWAVGRQELLDRKFGAGDDS